MVHDFDNTSQEIKFLLSPDLNLRENGAVLFIFNLPPYLMTPQLINIMVIEVDEIIKISIKEIRMNSYGKD